MGNDGGSIPTRRELAKTAARSPNTTELKATQSESQTHAWTYCPLSQRPLAAPIVSDSAGKLYNKDAIIEVLLPSEDGSAKSEHEAVLGGRVKSLRDVVEVKFSIEKDPKNNNEKRVCPITSKELGATTRAVYVIPCGHAFAESAVKEVPGDTCLQCNEPYKPENVIAILPIAKDEIERLAARSERLKQEGLTHSLKKAPGGGKKRKKHAEESTDVATAGVDTALQSTKTSGGGIKNSATASLTAKVVEELGEANKRRKTGLNDNLKSLFSNTGANASRQKGGDFMTRGFSVPIKR